MNNKINRQNNLDLLRIISCLFVVMIHVSATWISPSNNLLNDNNNFYAVLINTCSKFAVPVFFMLSGYFNLSNNNNAKVDTFYKKTIKKIIIPTFIFSIFYIFIKIVEYVILKKQEFNTIFIEIISGNLGALWYLYALIPMYFLVPWLIKIKEKIGENKFIKISFIYFIFSLICGLTSNFSISWNLGNSLNYLGYFLIGYGLSKEKTKLRYNLICTTFLGLIFGFLNVIIVYNLNYVNSFEFDISTNFSILNAIYSICIFLVFMKLKCKINFSWLSKYTFYIYIFHPLILSIIKIVFKGYLYKYNNVLTIILLTNLIFLISLIISYVYMNIHNYIESKYEIDEKISNKVILLLKK